jgi:hypothetical protein
MDVITLFTPVTRDDAHSARQIGGCLIYGLPFTFKYDYGYVNIQNRGVQ